MQPPLITLTTDFGSDSHYVAQMKGVILGICPNARVVDITHRVAPQDIAQAAWILRQVLASFPADTCHVAVVDPGVGTSRSIVLARIAAQFFVAPDNGLLWPLAQQSAPEWIRQLTRREFWALNPTPTFHGRDIMAPVAAHLGQGVSPAELGALVSQLVPLAAEGPRRTDQGLEGRVVFVDAFGNLITNIDARSLDTLRSPIHVHLPRQGITCHGLVSTYGQRAAGELVALIGSTQQLEIAVVQGNASQRLGVELGDPVQVRD
jgi:hypothetical protein